MVWCCGWAARRVSTLSNSTKQFELNFLTFPLIGDWGIDAVLEIVFPGADIVQWLMKNLSVEDPGRLFFLTQNEAWTVDNMAAVVKSRPETRSNTRCQQQPAFLSCTNVVLWWVPTIVITKENHDSVIGEGAAAYLIPTGICSLHSWGHAHRQPDSRPGVLLPYFRSHPHPQRWRHLLSFSGEQATPWRASRRPRRAVFFLAKGRGGGAEFMSLLI